VLFIFCCFVLPIVVAGNGSGSYKEAGIVCLERRRQFFEENDETGLQDFDVVTWSWLFHVW
jgi:hypothetical protein